MKVVVQSSTVRVCGRRPGFTLLEAVAVMWGMGILMLVGVAIIVGVFKIQDATEAGYTQASRQETLVDQFREDVARAVAAPASIDKWTAGPAVLILRTSEGGHIVYATQNERLERWRLPKGDVYTLHAALAGTRMEFMRSGPDGRLVTMRLTPPPASTGKARDSLDIAAALGGDLR
jgi:type II secretory pathway pseudopilin PulG